VEARWKTWQKNRNTQSKYFAQLEWEAHVCEYVSFLASELRSSGPISSKIPILGPRFIPPTYLHAQRRSPSTDVVPDTTYLKPLNVVHPFFYPGLDRCPTCSSSGDGLMSDGWNPKGHRELHGVSQEETAIGVQFRCKKCKEKYGKKAVEKAEGSFCFVTTNTEFWEKIEHWNHPSESPDLLTNHYGDRLL
ncbi:hypothetical protein C8Q80DRAFT_1092856, partial [Daedaleopsis nitida]